MKAILVIKLPEQTDIKNLLVSYRVFDRANKNHEVMKGAKWLIPMPEKIDIPFKGRANGYFTKCRGWNACIDKILGETE